MKKILEIIKSCFKPIGQAITFLVIFLYLCVIFLEYAFTQISNYLTITWWSWKTHLRLFRRKLNNFKTKVWNFLKTIRWGWIFIAYFITFFFNVLFKDWKYIDYIWIWPFILLMIMLAFNEFTNQDTLKPNNK